MAKASDNLFPYVHVVPAAAPASPAAGSQRLYLDSADSNKLKRKDSSGTVVSIEGGGSIPSWTSYTPTWTAATGTPAVGTGGSLTGDYQQLDKTVIFRLNLVLGTTGMSTGTGDWKFGLPVAHVTAPSGIGNHGVMVSGYFEDLSTRSYGISGGLLGASSTTTFRITYSLNADANNGSAGIMGATSPFTWGSGDYLSIYGMYKAA
jgi:hypothetical protein